MTYRYRVVVEVESDHPLRNGDLHETFTCGCWDFEDIGEVKTEAVRVTAHSTNPKLRAKKESAA